MITAKSVVAFPSDRSDRKYREMIVTAIIEYLRSLNIGDTFTKTEICELADGADWKKAEVFFRKARRQAERYFGVYIRTVNGIGYRRVDHEEGVELCESDIKNGMKKVGRGVERTYNLDLNQLSDGKRDRVLQTRAAYGQTKLLQDLSGK